MMIVLVIPMIAELLHTIMQEEVLQKYSISKLNPTDMFTFIHLLTTAASV